MLIKALSEHFLMLMIKINYKIKKKSKNFKNIFLPKAYKLILYPGDKIEILIIHLFFKSHWIAKGSKQDPIIIFENENNNGGGIYIFDNKEKNIIKM